MLAIRSVDFGIPTTGMDSLQLWSSRSSPNPYSEEGQTRHQVPTGIAALGLEPVRRLVELAHDVGIVGCPTTVCEGDA